MSQLREWHESFLKHTCQSSCHLINYFVEDINNCWECHEDCSIGCHGSSVDDCEPCSSDLLYFIPYFKPRAFDVFNLLSFIFSPCFKIADSNSFSFSNNFLVLQLCMWGVAMWGRSHNLHWVCNWLWFWLKWRLRSGFWWLSVSPLALLATHQGTMLPVLRGTLWSMEIVRRQENAMMENIWRMKTSVRTAMRAVGHVEDQSTANVIPMRMKRSMWVASGAWMSIPLKSMNQMGFVTANASGLELRRRNKQFQLGVNAKKQTWRLGERPGYFGHRKWAFNSDELSIVKELTLTKTMWRETKWSWYGRSKKTRWWVMKSIWW